MWQSCSTHGRQEAKQEKEFMHYGISLLLFFFFFLFEQASIWRENKNFKSLPCNYLSMSLLPHTVTRSVSTEIPLN